MDDHQPGRRHLIGLDGPEVRIPPAIAYWIETPLREWLEEIRARGASAKLVGEVIDDISYAARFYEADQLGASAIGTAPGDGTPTGETLQPTRWMSTKEAAEEIGCSARHVRTLAASGDLKAKQSGRAWVIDAASLPPRRKTA